MALIEMMGQKAAQDGSGGGLESFFESPLGMILAPRLGARFAEAKRQQFLMQQIQRKQDFAYKFADSIKGTDPLSAAAIYADPSTIDNVLTMYHQDRTWQQHNTIEQQQKIDAEKRAAEIAKQAEIDKNNLPGAAGYHVNAMGRLLPVAIASNVQGPNKPGLPTAGEVAAKDITPQEMIMGLSKAYSLPNLDLGGAERLMTDPKAAQDLQTAQNTRINQRLDAAKNTVDVVIDGKTYKMAQNPDTGAYDVKVGEVPPSATMADASSRTVKRIGPDGKAHLFGFDTKVMDYTKDLGLVPPPDNSDKTKWVDLQGEDGKTHRMGWSTEDQDYTRDMGLAPPKNGEPIYNDKGEITGYVGGAGPKALTEGQAKAASLWEASKGAADEAMSNFDELYLPQNIAGLKTYDYGGGAAMTGKGQVGLNAVKQLAQTYIYAQSGQQAPDSEVNRIMAQVLPGATDKAELKAYKKRLLYAMRLSIKAKTKEGLTAEDMASAPKWDGTKTISMPTAGNPPPKPDYMKDISDKIWADNPQLWDEEE